MNPRIEKRLQALEGKMTTERPHRFIRRLIVNADGTYTGEILRTDLRFEKPRQERIFDEGLKGRNCESIYGAG